MLTHDETGDPDELTLEQARSDREGAEWLRGHEAEVGPLSIGDDTAEAIAQISQRAFDMIVGFEVTSQQRLKRATASRSGRKASPG